MKPPTEFELERFFAHAYDTVKAHNYYEKHKKLKGRKPGRGADPPAKAPRKSKSPITGRIPEPQTARTQQRAKLSKAIRQLEGQLRKLESFIKKKETEGVPKHPKLEAKKERANKKASKPKAIVGNGKPKAELKHSKSPDTKQPSVEELKSLATRVRGQIAVAKQKLAAL